MEWMHKTTTIRLIFSRRMKTTACIGENPLKLKNLDQQKVYKNNYKAGWKKFYTWGGVCTVTFIDSEPCQFFIWTKNVLTFLIKS